jgi:co-chaperonin GroES (HSP10)
MYSSELQSGQKPDALSRVPLPVGYKMLLALPKVEEKTSGGVYKTDDQVKREEVASVVAYVLKQGPDCYNDPKKFPTGAWCKEQDWVIIRPYAGTRVKIHGQEFRLINDDAIEAVIDDPSGFERAGA